MASISNLMQHQVELIEEYRNRLCAAELLYSTHLWDRENR